MRYAVLNSIRVALGALLLPLVSPSLLAQEPQSDKAESEKQEPAPLPTAGTKGYTLPKCLNCQAAKYSKEAVKQKYEGPVTLTLVVDETERPKNIAAQR